MKDSMCLATGGVNTDACGRRTFRCPTREGIGNIRVFLVPDVISMRLAAVRKDDGDDLRIEHPRARRGTKTSGKRHEQATPPTVSARTNRRDRFSRIVGKDALQKVFP